MAPMDIVASTAVPSQSNDAGTVDKRRGTPASGDSDPFGNLLAEFVQADEPAAGDADEGDGQMRLWDKNLAGDAQGEAEPVLVLPGEPLSTLAQPQGDAAASSLEAALARLMEQLSQVEGRVAEFAPGELEKEMTALLQNLSSAQQDALQQLLGGMRLPGEAEVAAEGVLGNRMDSLLDGAMPAETGDQSLVAGLRRWLSVLADSAPGSGRLASPGPAQTVGGTDATPPGTLISNVLAGKDLAKLVAGDSLPAMDGAGKLVDLDLLGARQAAGSAVAPDVLPGRASAVLTHGQGAARASAAPALAIPLQTGTDGWKDAVGERVLWMVGKQLQHAQVRLNPRHLGPLEIRVAVNNDQASVSFSAPHALTREALEAAVPRLRDMLAEQQLDLVNVDVGAGDGAGRQAHADGRHASGVSFPGASEDDSPAVAGAGSAAAVRVAAGLVDDYA